MTHLGSNRADGENGFTLIEVLVALGLLALTAAMLAGIVTGSRQVFRLLARNEAVNSVAPVQGYLRAALAATTLSTEKGDVAAALPPVLTGVSDRVAFSTSYAQHGQFEGVYRVDLSLRARDGHRQGFDLVVTQALLRPATVAASAASRLERKSTVLENVAGLSIGYFGKPDAAVDSWEWLTQWGFTDRLPAIVRIEVRFARGDPRVWQALDVGINVAN